MFALLQVPGSLPVYCVPYICRIGLGGTAGTAVSNGAIVVSLPLVGPLDEVSDRLLVRMDVVGWE